MPALRAINPLIRRYGPKAEVVEAELSTIWKEPSLEDLVPSARHFSEDSLVKGRVITAEKDRVIVDIGAKTVGIISSREFDGDDEKPKVGDEVTVLIEELENDDGLIGLSKRKADRKINWEMVVAKHSEGDTVRGKVTNSPAPLYVAVQDASGRVGVVVHPEPAVVATAKWIEWRIPFREFAAAGVDMARVKKLCIGLGDTTAPAPGGVGMIFIDDVRAVRPGSVE